jgi:cytochrome c
VPCHRGMPGAIGPDLAGVVGRAPGSLSDFRYSSAMQRAGGAWTPDRLRAFVKEPQVVVPGTRMPFSGLPATRDAEDVVAYLASLR